MLWSVARASGTIDDVQSFIGDIFSLPSFKFNANLIFRYVALSGLAIVFAGTVATTLGAVIFNLISDLIGGVWVTVIEEERAEPVSGSNRQRRVE